jgi:hypothetical protein
MRVFRKLLLTALLLLCGICLYSQSKRDANSGEILARLSYKESGTFKCCLKEPPADGKFKLFIPAIDQTNICIAVSETGDYRVAMILDGTPQRLEGKMPDDKLQQLKTLLSSSDFRSLSGDHGALLRQDAETFAAEISRSNAAGVARKQRVQWLNPDNNNPFPGSVLKVISWLKDFRPQGGKQLIYSEFSDVCPSRGFQLLQPSVATDSAH